MGIPPSQRLCKACSTTGAELSFRPAEKRPEAGALVWIHAQATRAAAWICFSRALLFVCRWKEVDHGRAIRVREVASRRQVPLVNLDFDFVRLQLQLQLQETCHA